jgi:hypothetical protein
MLRIGCSLDKVLEIHRASSAMDLPGVYLLEAKNIRFEPVELWAEDGSAVFEGSPFLMRVAETFEIEGADPHLGGTEERIALQVFSGPKGYSAASPPVSINSI